MLCEGRKPLFWGYQGAQIYWRREQQKSGDKVNIPMDLESSAPTKHMAGSPESCCFHSTRHFKCSHSPFPQLQKPPTHQVLPKNKVGWDGEAKDKQRCCHHIEAIFHFENRGDQWLGSIWECQKSCMDQWCSTREEGSANQDKSPGQSSGMLGNIWCFAGWTQQGWERL